jgi:hypothetical protein
MLKFVCTNIFNWFRRLGRELQRGFGDVAVRASGFHLSRYGLNMGFLRVLRFPPTGKVDRVG